MIYVCLPLDNLNCLKCIVFNLFRFTEVNWQLTTEFWTTKWFFSFSFRNNFYEIPRKIFIIKQFFFSIRSSTVKCLSWYKSDRILWLMWSTECCANGIFVFSQNKEMSSDVDQRMWKMCIDCSALFRCCCCYHWWGLSCFLILYPVANHFHHSHLIYAAEECWRRNTNGNWLKIHFHPHTTVHTMHTQSVHSTPVSGWNGKVVIGMWRIGYRLKSDEYQRWNWNFFCK